MSILPTVILLAAGKSSRMNPLGDKIFFKYFNKTLLEHQYDNLLQAGLRKFIIVGNKKNIKKIQTILNSQKNITYAVQNNLDQGIMGGVLAALKKIDHQLPVILVSSNDFVEKNIFKKTVNLAQKSQSPILMVGKTVENYFPGGYLKLNHKNHITNIVEKPTPGTEPSNIINLVIQYFKNTTKLLEAYKSFDNKNDDAHELALQKMFDEKVDAKVVNYNKYWQALKYPWHHLGLMNHFLNNMKTKFVHPQATVSKNAIINGKVYISANVKIMDFAIINGPAFIGENTIVGNHVLIRNSHVGNDCVIGHTTEICRSYLSGHIWTHQNFIGDSIIDENVSFGAGTKTGNFRLDEQEVLVMIKDQKINSNQNKLGAIIGKNVRIGINASIMPGIKIGANSFIGAGLVVDKNIPEKSFLKGEFIIKNKINNQKALKRNNLI